MTTEPAILAGIQLLSMARPDEAEGFIPGFFFVDAPSLHHERVDVTILFLLSPVRLCPAAIATNPAVPGRLFFLCCFLIVSAIHDLDIARWLMGSRGANEPVRIYATGACNVDKSILELKDSNPSEAIDTANILIEFESGSTATIQVTTLFYCAYIHRLGTAEGRRRRSSKVLSEVSRLRLIQVVESCGGPFTR